MYIVYQKIEDLLQNYGKVLTATLNDSLASKPNYSEIWPWAAHAVDIFNGNQSKFS
ncbi:hypothetical protein TUM19329_07370 [Legionella antarctica]|uniref:Uncharacterized protein n=1 Tax=Legionella antarctica TaxID=2708020 RepID=A0A6F8T337_9GAMM|nr:hypothetical protein TUM19329_07370 [Legionella antarctica]